MKTNYLLLLSLTSILILQRVDAGENGSDITRGGNISLGDVTAVALANNPSLKEALRQWNAARARIPQAAAWADLRGGDESRVHRLVDAPAHAFMGQSAR